MPAALVLAYLETVFVEHRAAQRPMLAPRHVYPRRAISLPARVTMLFAVVLRGFRQTIVLQRFFWR